MNMTAQKCCTANLSLTACSQHAMHSSRYAPHDCGLTRMRVSAVDLQLDLRRLWCDIVDIDFPLPVALIKQPHQPRDLAAGRLVPVIAAWFCRAAPGSVGELQALLFQ